jgi:hypothetical protein
VLAIICRNRTSIATRDGEPNIVGRAPVGESSFTTKNFAEELSKLTELRVPRIYAKYALGERYKAALVQSVSKLHKIEILELCIGSKDENGTEISRTEPRRFPYFIRSNSHFCVRLYRFCFCISNVKVENGLDIF